MLRLLMTNAERLNNKIITIMMIYKRATKRQEKSNHIFKTKSSNDHVNFSLVVVVVVVRLLFLFFILVAPHHTLIPFQFTFVRVQCDVCVSSKSTKYAERKKKKVAVKIEWK